MVPHVDASHYRACCRLNVHVLLWFDVLWFDVFCDADVCTIPLPVLGTVPPTKGFVWCAPLGVVHAGGDLGQGGVHRVLGLPCYRLLSMLAGHVVHE